MSNSPRLTANVTLQVYALLFLILGGGIGAMLGEKVGAASGGGVADLTTIPTDQGSERAFNWLFFEIGIAAGLISCAVLLAATFSIGTLQRRVSCTCVDRLRMKDHTQGAQRVRAGEHRRLLGPRLVANPLTTSPEQVTIVTCSGECDLAVHLVRCGWSGRASHPVV